MKAVPMSRTDNVHMLPEVGGPLGAQCGNGGEGGQHAAGVVHGVAELDRRAVGITGQVAQTAQGGKHRGVASVVALRAALSVGGEGHQHDVGAHTTQFLVSQPQPVQHSGTEILQHQVRDRHQSQGEFHGPGVLQVQAGRHLVGVNLLEAGRRLTVHGVGTPGDVQAGRAFDLDDLGAELGQHQPGKGPGGMYREVSDPDPGQRPVPHQITPDRAKATASSPE